MKSTIGLLILAALLFDVAIGAKMIEKIFKDAGEVLAESITNRTVRQCSCDEQHFCVEDEKKDAFKCFDQCWSVVKAITNDTVALKKCADDKIPAIGALISCMEKSVKSCHKDANGPNITYVDYSKAFTSGESRIRKQMTKLTKSVSKSAGKFITTVTKLGECMRRCYLKKNDPTTSGFCFDRKGCQPKTDAKLLVKGLKKCSTTLKLTQHVFEWCTCAGKAGVSSIKPYCSMMYSNEKVPATTPK